MNEKWGYAVHKKYTIQSRNKLQVELYYEYQHGDNSYVGFFLGLFPRSNMKYLVHFPGCKPVYSFFISIILYVC